MGCRTSVPRSENRCTYTTCSPAEGDEFPDTPGKGGAPAPAPALICAFPCCVKGTSIGAIVPSPAPKYILSAINRLPCCRPFADQAVIAIGQCPECSNRYRSGPGNCRSPSTTCATAQDRLIQTQKARLARAAHRRHPRTKSRKTRSISSIISRLLSAELIDELEGRAQAPRPSTARRGKKPAN